MIQDAFELIPQLLAAREKAGGLLLGLDFDGTLAPIVPVPDAAAMPEDLRPVIEALVRRDDTHVAFISGRGLHDLAARAGVADAYYAGNHGLEIDGPDVHRVHEAAAAAAAQLKHLADQLRNAVAFADRATVEDKGLTLSVHYRQVEDENDARRVRDAVHACTAGDVGLQVTDGKRVVEIKPAVDWDKGRALVFLRSTLEQRHGPAPAVFIGDDRTDEDAFRELGDDDYAIVVGDPPPADTAARAHLADTDAVARFLRMLSGEAHS